MRKHRDRVSSDHDENVSLIALADVNVPEHVIARIMRKDHAQINRMRADYESGRDMVRVILRPRCGGGYEIEDGRHRVIAAKLAGEAHIEALIVGS